MAGSGGAPGRPARARLQFLTKIGFLLDICVFMSYNLAEMDSARLRERPSGSRTLLQGAVDVQVSMPPD